MTCDPASTAFEDYLDGQLPQPDREALDRHMSTCGHCQSELSRLRSLRSMLAELPAPSAPPGALEAILRAAVRPTRASRPRWQHPRWFAPGLAVAAALLVAVGMRVGAPGPGATATGPQLVLTAQPVLLDTGVQRVALLFRATEAVQDADISLSLPPDVQIAGRPHLRDVSWHINLKRGPNVLELPLLATGTHSGTLVVQITGGSLLRRLDVPISMRASREPGSASRSPFNASPSLGA